MASTQFVSHPCTASSAHPESLIPARISHSSRVFHPALHTVSSTHPKSPIPSQYLPLIQSLLSLHSIIHSSGVSHPCTYHPFIQSLPSLHRIIHSSRVSHPCTYHPFIQSLPSLHSIIHSSRVSHSAVIYSSHLVSHPTRPMGGGGGDAQVYWANGRKEGMKE